MAKTAEDLRLELQRAAVGQNRGRLRYPPALRREVGTFVAQDLSQGRSQSQLAREFGITQPTLRRWMEEAATGGEFRPVEISGGPGPAISGGILLRSPRGYSVEGLDVESLAALLRVLG